MIHSMLGLRALTLGVVAKNNFSLVDSSKVSNTHKISVPEAVTTSTVSMPKPSLKGKSNIQNYHPGLSSLEKAKNNYDVVTSDHVPIIASIPLRGDIAAASKDALQNIKIVSWNVLQSDSANGFAPLGQGSYGETSEQMQARHDRIVNALVKFVEKNKPHFICLQEIVSDSDKENLYSKIRSQLLSYSPIELASGEVVDAHGCITFYNSQQFTPVPGAVQKKYRQFKYDPLGANSTEYTMLGNEKLKIRIANVHSAFKSIPASHEESIKKYLSQTEEENILSIVIGDFNCTVAPLDSVSRNITTSVAPSIFRDNKLQGACAIDSCFYAYSHKNNASVTCQQVSIEHLNCETGTPYDHQRDLTQLNISNLPELQKNEVARYEMAVCVDESFKTKKLINNKYTIYEYQDYLQTALGDTSLLVRHAKNLNNKDGIGITLTNSCYSYIKSNKDSKIKFRIIEDGISPQYAVYTNRYHVQNLMKQIDDYCIIDEIYTKLYKELLEITKNYLSHLRRNPSKNPDEIKLCDEKLKFVHSIHQKLQDSNTQLIVDKMQTINQIYTQISENKDMGQYRGPDWKRYLRNMGALIACTLFPIGGVAAIVSKIKYNTFQFWQPTGYKEKERMLSNIASTKNRVKNR